MVERCPRCQCFLVSPPQMPLLRRPLARAALLAGFLGVLGAISYGITGCVGLVLALWVLRGLRQPEQRRVSAGVGLLARGAAAISLIGAVSGGWIGYRSLIVPHAHRLQSWEQRTAIRNTFRELNAAEMRFALQHPALGYSASLEQLAASPEHMGLSREMTIGRLRLRHFGYQYQYQPGAGRPIRTYRISASPLLPARGACFQSGPQGVVRRDACGGANGG